MAPSLYETLGYYIIYITSDKKRSKHFEFHLLVKYYHAFKVLLISFS